MRMIVAMPIHDVDGELTEKILERSLILKMIFRKAVVSITPVTEEKNPDLVKKLKKNTFFEVILNKEGTHFGDHYLAAFKGAVKTAKKGEIIHFCNQDRLIFIIDNYLDTFKKDLKGKKTTIFQRSDKAWQSHPINYRATESMATDLGFKLFGKKFDFFWCSFSMSKENLAKTNSLVKDYRDDYLICAEMILLNFKKITIKEVDWLAWEDPYIFHKDADKFKKEKESDEKEGEKRLAYVIPTIKYLLNLKAKNNLRENFKSF